MSLGYTSGTDCQSYAVPVCSAVYSYSGHDPLRLLRHIDADFISDIRPEEEHNMRSLFPTLLMTLILRDHHS